MSEEGSLGDTGIDTGTAGNACMSESQYHVLPTQRIPMVLWKEDQGERLAEVARRESPVREAPSRGSGIRKCFSKDTARQEESVEKRGFILREPEATENQDSRA